MFDLFHASPFPIKNSFEKINILQEMYLIGIHMI